jgi:transcriptional regulator with XRE-family HTH domain
MEIRFPGLHSGRMEDLKRHLAEVFRAGRLRKKLTQEALADAAGVTTETVSNSERAESLVSLPVFLKLVELLDIDVQSIIYFELKVPDRKTARRRRLEGDLQCLADGLSDRELTLLLDIGRLLVKQNER